ncbi:serine protease [Candidatus Kaiserbacteria bacterium]|nr:serine protease [Candidatus Kaiserbacteria bacterium]
MSPRLQSFILNLATLAFIAVGFFYLVDRHPGEIALEKIAPTASSSTQTAAVNTSLEAPPPPPRATATPKKVATTTVKTVTKKTPAQKPIVQKEPDTQARRIQNPYSFAPVPFESIDAITRPALVNILCRPRGAGPIASPISGSGVLIDPRGVILTNAHVAQYVLLAQSSRVNLSCAIRTGAPAIPRWSAEILYIPPVWVEAHAREIAATHPMGTGEHDYALLRITGTLDSTPLPVPFPYLPVDTRDAIGFRGDKVLAVSYPAEFLGSSAQFTMYPASSVTTIGQLMTFIAKTVDLISLGGIIEAQGGSSGGAVVNAWGRLIALISTTSEGDTTATRDLRAISLSYIDRDLAAQTRFDIATTLGGDVAAEALEFNTKVAPKLIELYLAEIAK